MNQKISSIMLLLSLFISFNASGTIIDVTSTLFCKIDSENATHMAIYGSSYASRVIGANLSIYFINETTHYDDADFTLQRELADTILYLEDDSDDYEAYFYNPYMEIKTLDHELFRLKIKSTKIANLYFDGYKSVNLDSCEFQVPISVKYPQHY